MTKFSFLFYELDILDRNINFGYQSRGYPNPKRLLHSFSQLNYNLQPIEENTYMSLTKERKKEKYYNPYAHIGNLIENDKVLIQWDGITTKRDYHNIFNWNKDLYIIPHHEGNLYGASNKNEQLENELRQELTDNSKGIIFQLNTLRKLWGKQKKKYHLLYSPVRTAIEYDKDFSKKILGINTPLTIMCWGFYTTDQNKKIMQWITNWKDTTLLFCGSGYRDQIINLEKKSKELGIEERVKFSKPRITDEEADLWFSATDLCVSARKTFGTSTTIYITGQGKTCITGSFDKELDSYYREGYQELEKITGTVYTNKLKETTRQYLDEPELREKKENQAKRYSLNNSFLKYSQRIGEIMNE